MNWLSSNWIWIALAAAFIAFHIFGHGRHRHGYGHDGHAVGDGANNRQLPTHDHGTTAADAGATGADAGPQAITEQRKRRHHGC